MNERGFRSFDPTPWLALFLGSFAFIIVGNMELASSRSDSHLSREMLVRHTNEMFSRLWQDPFSVTGNVFSNQTTFTAPNYWVMSVANTTHIAKYEGSVYLVMVAA